jgi:hypothetical protein
MLAPLGAPNEFGLDNRSKKWRFMLAVSDATDDWGRHPYEREQTQCGLGAKRCSMRISKPLGLPSKRTE